MAEEKKVEEESKSYLMIPGLECYWNENGDVVLSQSELPGYDVPMYVTIPPIFIPKVRQWLFEMEKEYREAHRG